MAKSQHQRVVVTGMGIMSSLGNSVDATWSAIKNGNTGIAKIQQWDVTDWQFSLGAEIKDYNPREMIADRKLLKLLSRQDVLGLYAVKQALDQSQMLAYRESLSDAKDFNDQTGVFVGSPGNRFAQQYDFLKVFEAAKGDMKKFGEETFNFIHPMWLLCILPNNVLAYVGIQNGFKGANENITNHGVSGIQAIAEAAHWIQRGKLERAVVVSYESGVEPEGQIYYGELGVLSATGCRPFDKTRDGTILAEGAGALILESYESAQKRGATIYGEILGAAYTSEAKGVFPIDEQGEGLTRSIQLSLQTAKQNASDINFVTAHGNGNAPSEVSEATAICASFGANKVPVVSFKGALGHTLGAAGTVETVLTLLALNEKIAPGTVGLQEKAPDCSMLDVTPHTRSIPGNKALLINKGFGSMNACLVVQGASA